MKIYRIVGYLIALEVFVQAATHAYGSAGLGHWIWSEGHTATRAVLEEDSGVDITGRWAATLHGENGAMVIPLLAIAFLAVAIVTRRRVAGGVKWAGLVLGLVVLQAALGFATIAIPVTGLVHGANALLLLLAALHAARLPERGQGELAPQADKSPAEVRSP